MHKRTPVKNRCAQPWRVVNLVATSLQNARLQGSRLNIGISRYLFYVFFFFVSTLMLHLDMIELLHLMDDLKYRKVLKTKINTYMI